VAPASQFELKESATDWGLPLSAEQCAFRMLFANPLWMDGCLVLSSVNRSRQGQMTLGCESLIQHFVGMEQSARELN
jgi:hypothetical protein